jgi:hypothetical protein
MSAYAFGSRLSKRYFGINRTQRILNLTEKSEILCWSYTGALVLVTIGCLLRTQKPKERNHPKEEIVE